MADKLTSVYGKPLAKGLATDVHKALERLKWTILKEIRKKLMQSPFSDRAKKSFAMSMTAKVVKNTLIVTAKHPAFIKMIEGQKSGQMSWLVKAKGPIPIVTETGDVIFRSATPKSMKDGKWVHPGRSAQTFVEKAKEEARSQLRVRIAEELRKAAKKAVRKNK